MIIEGGRILQGYILTTIKIVTVEREKRKIVGLRRKDGKTTEVKMERFPKGEKGEGNKQVNEEKKERLSK